MLQYYYCTILHKYNNIASVNNRIEFKFMIINIKYLLNIDGNNYLNQFLEEIYISNFYIENKS